MKHQNTLLFAVAFILFATVATPVFAQDNAGITLIPATIEEAADPGSTIEEVLTVTNESDVEREFYVYTRDIKGVEAGGVPVFAEEAEKTGYEITEWIQLGFEKITVPAFGSTKVPVVINVPPMATPGSHFGGIFVSVEPPKLRQIGAGVGYQVASVVSIRISGDIIDTARIRSFSTDKLVYGTKKVVFTAKVENQGNILIRPRGPVTITSMFGTDPEVFTVNDSLAGVFPGTMRDFDFTWESEGIGFGRYEAVLALGYDGENGQRTIDASLVFWVFPTKIILTILGIFIGIFVLGYVFTKYYINQAILRAAGGRRIVSSRMRRQTGISRFVFVFVSLMALTVMFLLVLLVLFA
jgi:hypothetical protein